MIVRWDDVAVGQDIGLAAGAVNVGLHRLEIAPGETAGQADAPVEEVVFVLEGSSTRSVPVTSFGGRRAPGSLPSSAEATKE